MRGAYLALISIPPLLIALTGLLPWMLEIIKEDQTVTWLQESHWGPLIGRYLLLLGGWTAFGWYSQLWGEGVAWLFKYGKEKGDDPL